MAAPQDHDQTLIEAGGAAAALIERKARILDAFDERVRDALDVLPDAREFRGHA